MLVILDHSYPNIDAAMGNWQIVFIDDAPNPIPLLDHRTEKTWKDHAPITTGFQCSSSKAKNCEQWGHATDHKKTDRCRAGPTFHSSNLPGPMLGSGSQHVPTKNTLMSTARSPPTTATRTTATIWRRQWRRPPQQQLLLLFMLLLLQPWLPRLLILLTQPTLY